MERPDELPRWKSWEGFWLWVIAAVMVLLLLGAAVLQSLALPLLLLPGFLAVAFGLFEVLAPRRFLEWRDASTPREGFQREALQSFDEALGVRRDAEDRFDERSVRRVRAIGVVVTVFGIAAMAAAPVLHRAL